jgi:hypothetical protein
MDPALPSCEGRVQQAYNNTSRAERKECYTAIIPARGVSDAYKNATANVPALIIILSDIKYNVFSMEKSGVEKHRVLK